MQIHHEVENKFCGNYLKEKFFTEELQ